MRFDPDLRDTERKEVVQQLHYAEEVCEIWDQPLRELLEGVKGVLPDTWRAARSLREAIFWRHNELDLAAIVEDLLRIEENAELATVARQPDGMESGDSGDTFGDSQKKTKKPVRRTKVEHCDCERIYQEAKQKGFPLTLTQVVADYLDDNPNCKLTAQALLRGWKEHRRMLRGGDNLGTV